MKTPEELYAALGNRGEYSALPHVTLDEVKMIYSEGSHNRNQAMADRLLEAWWLLSYEPDPNEPLGVEWCKRRESWLCGHQDSVDVQHAVITKLRTAINEAIAISGTGTPQDWTAAQVGLCQALAEVKVMLGEK